MNKKNAVPTGAATTATNPEEKSVSVKKTDMFMIPLELIQADHSENGRFAPRGDIRGLADSLKEYGQLQPVGVRRLPKDAGFQLVYGFGRYEAMKLVNEDLPIDKQRPIKAVIVSTNDRGLFIANLVENCERAEPSPMDYAVNINRLMDDYTLGQKEVAKLFRKSQAWVSQHLQLIGMQYEVQERIHLRQITMTDALNIAANTDFEQQKVIAAEVKEAAEKIEAELPLDITHDDGAVQAEVSKAAKKVAHQAVAKVTGKPYITPASKKESGKRDTAPADGTGKRTFAEVKQLLEYHCNGNLFSKEVRKVAAVLLSAMDGKIREDLEFSNQFAAAIDRMKPKAIANAA